MSKVKTYFIYQSTKSGAENMAGVTCVVIYLLEHCQQMQLLSHCINRAVYLFFNHILKGQDLNKRDGTLSFSLIILN